MKKKSLAILLLVGFILLHSVGCSAFQLPKKSEPVTLRFLYEEKSANYPALAEEFHKEHPNITIELTTYKNLGDFYQRYASLMEGVDAVRLFIGASIYYAEQVPDGLLVLDPMLAEDTEFPHTDLFPGLMDEIRLEGKLIGIPAGLIPFLVYVNPQKFQAAGQPLPQPGWTVDEFVQAAKAVHRTDTNGQGTYGFCAQPEGPDPGIFLRLFGGGVVDDPMQPTAPVLDQPANETALVWYASLFNDHQVTLPFNLLNQWYAQFMTGNCAMWVDAMNAGDYGKPEGFDPVIVPLPMYDQPMTFVAMDNYAIQAKSEHPEEAWQWIRFLMGHEQGSGSYLPPLRSLIETDSYQASVSPSVYEIARSLPERLELLGIRQDPRELQANMQYYEALRRVLMGQQDVPTALEQAQKEALKAFEE